MSKDGEEPNPDGYTRKERNAFRVRQLYVSLPCERIYVVSARDGESCDVLEQFAQAAIPRIGA